MHMKSTREMTHWVMGGHKIRHLRCPKCRAPLIRHPKDGRFTCIGCGTKY